MKVEYKKNQVDLLGFAFFPWLIPVAGKVAGKVAGGILASSAARKQKKANSAAAKIQAEKNAQMLKIGMIVGIPGIVLLLIFKGKKKNDSPIQSKL